MTALLERPRARLFQAASAYSPRSPIHRSIPGMSASWGRKSPLRAFLPLWHIPLSEGHRPQSLPYPAFPRHGCRSPGDPSKSPVLALRPEGLLRLVPQVFLYCQPRVLLVLFPVVGGNRKRPSARMDLDNLSPEVLSGEMAEESFSVHSVSSYVP